MRGRERKGHKGGWHLTAFPTRYAPGLLVSWSAQPTPLRSSPRSRFASSCVFPSPLVAALPHGPYCAASRLARPSPCGGLFGCPVEPSSSSASTSGPTKTQASPVGHPGWRRFVQRVKQQGIAPALRALVSSVKRTRGQLAPTVVAMIEVSIHDSHPGRVQPRSTAARGVARSTATRCHHGLVAEPHGSSSARPQEVNRPALPA